MPWQPGEGGGRWGEERLLPAPGSPMMPWGLDGSLTQQRFTGVGLRAETARPHAYSPQPAPSLASTSLLPQGHNVSRRCTDEGWTELEPSPYPIACVTEPFLEEVGLSAPHPHQSSYPTNPTPTPAPSTLSHRGVEVAACVGARTPGLCPRQAPPPSPGLPFQGLVPWLPLLRVPS